MSIGKSEHLIIHDYFENFGGGERLIKVLYDTKDFDLIYGFEKNDLISKIKLSRRSLNLNKHKLPTIIKKILLKKNFENLNIKRKYKTYLLSGNYSIFSNLPINSKKIFYCHSLPRIFFEFKDFYRTYNVNKKFINIIFKKKYRNEYLIKLKSMDKILCNSIYTQKKIKKFTNLHAEVIYPPIEVNKFKWISQKKYFVSNNRHATGKNLEIIINVFKKFPEKNIYFTSTGPETSYLKKISKGFKNIIFTGFLNEKKYAYLIGNCSATINISSKEDFGMAAMESLAAGKPAITLNEGGYLETIKNNFNGFVFGKEKITNNLIYFLENINFDNLKKMRKNCEYSVKRFDKKIFYKKIKSFLNDK